MSQQQDTSKQTKERQDSPGRPEAEPNWIKTYGVAFLLGIVYVLLLGLFTYLFNNPI